MVAARSTSRFKQKPAVPFGDFMLPILGVIALGIVVVGIRILWSPSAPNKAITAQPRSSRSQPAVEPPAGGEKAPAAPKADEGAVSRKEPLRDVVIAQPVQQPEKTEAAEKPDPAPARRQNSQNRGQNTQQRAAPNAEPKRPASGDESKRADPPPASGKPERKPAAYPGSIEKSAYVVQCGSFSTRASADRAVASLKKIGYNPVVRKAEVNGKTVFRVIVAGGNDRASADEVAQVIKNAGHPVFVRPND